MLERVTTKVPATDRSAGEGSMLIGGAKSAPYAGLAHAALLHDIALEEAEIKAGVEEEEGENGNADEQSRATDSFDAEAMLDSGALRDVASLAVEPLMLSDVAAMLVLTPEEMTPQLELAAGNMQRLKWCFDI